MTTTKRLRVLRVVVVALALLSASVAVAAVRSPAGAQDDPDHSDWVPFVGELQMGCTRATGNPSDGFCSGHHNGWAVDFNLAFNTPIYAAGPGRVGLVEGDCNPNGGDPSCHNGAGNYIAIDHGDHWSRYMHLASFAAGIRVDSTVVGGQLIGFGGNSGTSGSGRAHLHYDEVGNPFNNPGRIFFGPMLACHGDTPVQYPDILGTTDWQAIPWGTIVRNDGYECLGGVTPKTPPPPPPPEAGPGGSVGLAFGDFDNSGHDDLAVGVPGEGFRTKDDAGLALVLYGSTSGTSRVERLRQQRGNQFLRGAAEPGDMLGASAATGDFDCDGRDDLAIGVPGEDAAGVEDSGLVSISYGGPSDVDNRPIVLFQGKWGLPDQRESGDLVGATLAAGDFDDDGCDDLAIGAPGETIGSLPNAGAVMVAYGQRGGFNASMRSEPLLYQGGELAGFTEAGDALGTSLAAGDFNCDSVDDLAIGVPGESIDGLNRAGAVSITHGARTGGLGVDAMTIYQSSGLAGILEAGDRVGLAVAAGDFDRDGCDDLAAGAPGEDLTGGNSAGAVSVSFGSPSGIREGSVHFQDDGGLEGDIEHGDWVGAALAAVDLNCDGFDDLAVGAPGEDISGAPDAGLVGLLRGSAGGMRTGLGTLYQQHGFGGINESGDAAGSALAGGDADGDGCGDLAIGIPGEAIVSRPNAGRVVVVSGSSGGPAGFASYSQRKNLPGRSEAGDSLGGPGIWDLLGLSFQ